MFDSCLIHVDSCSLGVKFIGCETHCTHLTCTDLLLSCVQHCAPPPPPLPPVPPTQSSLTMQHVQTTGSTALQGKGGMLFLRNAEATVVDSTDTFASSGTVGGSMYVEGLAGLHLFRRTTIKHSAAAEYGGFMAAKGTTVQLDRAHVENCTAVVGGGGMHLDTSAVTHDGCSFLDVHSAGSGGGLWMKSSRFVWHEGDEGNEGHAAVTTFTQSRSPVGSFATVHDQGNQLNHVDVRGSTSQPRHSLASSDSSDSSDSD